MDCPYCERTVEGVVEECGIGAYEFWGAPGYDLRYQLVCEHCGETLAEEYDLSDYDEDEDDPCD